MKLSNIYLLLFVLPFLFSCTPDNDTTNVTITSFSVDQPQEIVIKDKSADRVIYLKARYTTQGDVMQLSSEEQKLLDSVLWEITGYIKTDGSTATGISLSNQQLTISKDADAGTVQLTAISAYDNTKTAIKTIIIEEDTDPSANVTITSFSVDQPQEVVIKDRSADRVIYLKARYTTQGDVTQLSSEEQKLLDSVLWEITGYIKTDGSTATGVLLGNQQLTISKDADAGTVQLTAISAYDNTKTAIKTIIIEENTDPSANVTITSFSAEPAQETVTKYKYADRVVSLRATYTTQGDVTQLSSTQRQLLDGVSWEITSYIKTDGSTATGISLSNQQLTIPKDADVGTVQLTATSAYDNTKTAIKTIIIEENNGQHIILKPFSNTMGIVMDSEEQFVNLQLSQTEYNVFLNQDGFTSDFIKKVTDSIFNYFSDQFDFIFLLLDEESSPDGAYSYVGRHSLTSNSVTGIGLNVFSNNSQYGAGARLKGITRFPFVKAIRFGPFLHEIAHQWANFIVPTEYFYNNQSYDFIPHWGITGGNTEGQLGGFEQSSLQTNVDENSNKYKTNLFGGFANGGNGVPYSDMELYLMGMIPLSSVADFDVFTDIQSYTYNVNGYSEFVANTRTQYDQTKLSSLVNRSPNSGVSQKSFRGLVVIISSQEMTSYLSTVRQHISIAEADEDAAETFYNFKEATRGVGTLKLSQISEALKP